MIKINSKDEVIKWTKWLRKKLDNWGKEGYEKASVKEKREFINILRSVENFVFSENLTIRKSRNS
jgi:hypothetical protein